MDAGDEGKTAAYEASLRRRLELLGKELERGKIRFAEHLTVVESLKKVRVGPDGQIDLSTVDASVRSLALMVDGIRAREEMKASVSLAEIQSAYFEFIERNFRWHFDLMREKALTPHQVAAAMSSDAETVASVVSQLPAFLDVIREFWADAGLMAIAHVEDMNDAMKGIFGGDLFPSNEDSLASRCSIYADTLVLPDPFLRSLHVFEAASDETKTYYFVKHGLNILQYKDLAIADVVPPVVVILPDASALNADEKGYFLRLGEEDALFHTAKVFGREFGSFEEVFEFCSSLDTAAKAAAAVRNPDRVIFDAEWTGTLEDQITRAAQSESFGKLATEHPGALLAQNSVGRMSTSNELLLKAFRLGGTPIIDAPTSWKYFGWKLEYDAERRGAPVNLEDMHTMRGLQTLAENEMRWLGRVPHDALLELRRSDAIGEIRSILSKGVAELTATNPTNFHRTSDQVFDNIHAAFAEHQRNIDALSAKKWKFAGSDLGSWIVVGSLAATAAATGAPIWGLAALAADQVLRAPKLRDIPGSIKELADESKRLNASPVGLFFKIRGE